MTAPRDIGRTIRTARALKPRQIVTRVCYGLTRPRVKPRPHPALRCPAAGSRLHAPIARRDGWTSPTRVRLLNIERDFGAAIDWAAPGAPRLWVYHLHYFADLPRSAEPSDAAERSGTAARGWMPEVVRSWLDANPPGTPNAWDSYPLSRRIVNWIEWLLLAGASTADGAAAGDASSEIRERMLQSLAHQVRTLEKRIEYDVMANHLLANAKALAFAGLTFESEEADRWARTGFQLMFDELEEQVLPDGGHFERSPMYHAIVLEDILDVLNAWGVFPDAVPEPWRCRRGELEGDARRMLGWLAAMTHPDGGIAFMNDAAQGGAPPYDELADYARRLDVEARPVRFGPVHDLGPSGYVRLTSHDGRTVAIFDNGPIGPDYQPGHAHCDTLSLEISRDGERVLVNSGTSTYEPGEERLYERSTAAHNTVRIDGAEQSEMWGAFRVGRRAGVLSASASGDSAEGAHSGFRRLPGAPVHRRTVAVLDGRVEIRDSIEGRGTHLAEWFFHLHPDVAARPADGAVELSRRGRPIGRLGFPRELACSVEGGHWRPDFNVSLPNRRVVLTWRGPLPRDVRVTIDWAS